MIKQSAMDIAFWFFLPVIPAINIFSATLPTSSPLFIVTMLLAVAVTFLLSIAFYCLEYAQPINERIDETYFSSYMGNTSMTLNFSACIISWIENSDSDWLFLGIWFYFLLVGSVYIINKIKTHNLACVE